MCSLNLGIIFSYKNKLQLGNLEENSSELYLVSLIIKFRILTLIQLKDFYSFITVDDYFHLKIQLVFLIINLSKK